MVEDKYSEIVKQIEYYFGDLNLPRDKFLLSEIKRDEGWIPLEVMLKFNRLSKLSTNVEEIAKALEKSNLIVVSEDHKKIRRKPDQPLPENTLEYWHEVKARTIYVKGFDPETTTIEDVENYIGDSPTVQNIMMRKYKIERTFKGSVFVTFETQEEAENFVKDESKKTFKGKEMTVQMQFDYWTKKVQSTKEKRQAEKHAKTEKKAQMLEKQIKEVTAANYRKNAVLKLTGLAVIPNLGFSELKVFLKEFGVVEFVLYDNGSDEAQIRFKEENEATKALEKALAKGDGKFLFKDVELQGKVMEGKEEEDYWSAFTTQKIARDNNKEYDRKNNRKRKFKRPEVKSKHIRFDADGDSVKNDEEKNNHEQNSDSKTPNEVVSVEANKVKTE